MNIKIIFIAILISYHSCSFSKEYRCPDISKGTYSLNINKYGNWSFYATQKNSKNSLNNFFIDTKVVWERKTIEPIEYVESNLNNVISCYSYEDNFTIQAILLIPERSCHFKENNIFCCY
ncbi:hypothetical protein ACWNT8_09020 [Pigmentibacter ruber]|uniref:hypothetical protein n=1 Tax=Pigmentibacter ruber TaxID=2683196 RepID=UPI00131E756E|nr:hypothetical protein [Pigmentibacter ruber]BFD32574.1 hypothetical protein GTC16762_21920 [Pigmentibacter ruber]